MSNDDKFLNHILSLTRNRVQRATAAVDLKQQLLNRIEADSQRFTERIKRKQPSITTDTFGGFEMIKLDSGKERGALVVANTRGDEAFATYALFGFLVANAKHKFNIYATFRTRPRQGPIEFTPETLGRFRRLVREERIEQVLVLSDGMPYFDGFYVGLPDDKALRRAKSLVSHLKSLDFSLGRYSYEEDRPIHEILDSRNPLLLSLGSSRAKTIELIVSDDIRAGVTALEYLLNPKSHS